MLVQYCDAEVISEMITDYSESLLCDTNYMLPQKGSMYFSYITISIIILYTFYWLFIPQHGTLYRVNQCCAMFYNTFMHTSPNHGQCGNNSCPLTLCYFSMWYTKSISDLLCNALLCSVCIHAILCQSYVVLHCNALVYDS